MDFEDYFTFSYSPLKAIEILTDIIYYKSNDDWDIFSHITREHAEELLALNYAINLCAKKLLTDRKNYY